MVYGRNQKSESNVSHAVVEALSQSNLPMTPVLTTSSLPLLREHFLDNILPDDP